MSKYTGALMGCAIGDSLGIHVEGWKPQQIQRYVGTITGLMNHIQPIGPAGEPIKEDEYGKLKRWSSDAKRGDISDDTILTLAVAEAVLERGFDLEHMARKHLEAYEANRQPDGSYKGAFGGTTQLAFEALKNGISPYESGNLKGPGNAPAMKMGPIGLYAATDCGGAHLKFAEEVGRMTHLDTRSVASGMVQAGLVERLAGDEIHHRYFFHDAIMDLTAHCEEAPIAGMANPEIRLLDKMRWIVKNHDASVEETREALGNGGAVFESYPFAIFMFQKHWDNPKGGLLATVNAGGDCDTTGAIYGTLWGARDGLDALPKEWVDGINEKERILRVGWRFEHLDRMMNR
jgi:ADP-ribosylglycohydrolase